jgi:integrase/recombinase XerD
MTLEEMLDSYGKHLQALNRTPKTVKQYIQWVQRFFDFAETAGVKTPADVTSAHLLTYQKHLAGLVNKKGRIFNIKVQNHHMIGIVMFLRYLCAEGILAHNPAQHVQYAKVPQELPRDILSIPEIKKLLRAPDVRTVMGYRDRVILEVFYSTGIRKQELLDLTTDSVNLESSILMIRQGKGSKDRVVPLGKIAARYLETYMNGIRPTFLQIRNLDKHAQEKRLFLSMRGLPLSKNALADRIEHYRRVAGIEHPVTPHTFRHSCATHMIRNRANIRHVQEMLGHMNLNTTEKYLHLTITDLKEAHHKFHPREKDI